LQKAVSVFLSSFVLQKLNRIEHTRDPGKMNRTIIFKDKVKSKILKGKNQGGVLLMNL
jgi:hypothetical protein